MPASPIVTLTNRRVLNTIVNTRIKPHTALTNLLFPSTRKENLFEEFAQVDELTGGYGMAPFVKIGQKPAIRSALNGRAYTIQTPNISIERPLQWSTKFAKRHAGQGVFSNDPNVVQQLVRQAIEQDADFMNIEIDNRIEWMVAFILRGQIDYSVEGNDSFTISTGKPAINTFTVSVLWDSGSAVPLSDITDVKLIVEARRGPPPNVAICGATAGAALRTMLENKEITALQTTSGIDAGRATFRRNVEADGMLFIGEFAGIDHFQYTGTFLDDDGVTVTPFIRDDYVEYFNVDQRGAEARKMFFGMIDSLKAVMEGNAVTERYMTSIPPDDRIDVYTGIIKTRPLPWFFRADWNVSMKVT